MKISWSYVAGFFDGEGSISVVRRKVESTSCVTVSFAQSSDDDQPPPILAEISALLTEHGIRHGLYDDKRSTGRTGELPNGRVITTRRISWKIQIFNRAGCQRVLELLGPYLRVKKVRAEDTIRFMKLFPDMRGRFTPSKKVA